MTKPLQTSTGSAKSLPDLFARAGVRPVGGQCVPDVPVTSIVDDSRNVRPGACFVAVRGVAGDGHRYTDAATRAGAVAIVLEGEDSKPRSANVIRVEDSRSALAKLASAFYGLRNDDACPLCLAGITGTNGKTTVAWLLRSILDAAGYRPALLGTIEYDLVAERLPAPLTTPGPLDLCRHLATARDAGATHAVIEVSSHALDQRRCDGLLLTTGTFTNLSGDHLDYHTTMERYARAKGRLFELLEANGVAVINRDDAVGESLLGRISRPCVSYSLECDAADFVGSVVEMSLAGSRFSLRGPSLDTTVFLPLVGRHNVANALAAAATAYGLGVGPDSIRAGLERLSEVPGRLHRATRSDAPFTVLVDYAHTDAALDSALSALRHLTRGRLVCVFGCGGDRDRGKRPRMAAAVSRWADVAVVTSDNPRTEEPGSIIDDILPGFGDSPSCEVRVESDRRCAIESAVAEARPGDTVLIAGKGHETVQLVGRDVLSFDDMVVARRCLHDAAVAGDVA